MRTPWQLLSQTGIALSAKVSSFDGNIPLYTAESPFSADGECTLAAGGARWRCIVRLTQVGGAVDGTASFRLEEGREPCGNAAVSFAFGHWSKEHYVLLPAAAYGGNRFRTAASSARMIGSISRLNQATRPFPPALGPLRPFITSALCCGIQKSCRSRRRNISMKLIAQ